jgi:hypothetical protein
MTRDAWRETNPDKEPQEETVVLPFLTSPARGNATKLNGGVIASAAKQSFSFVRLLRRSCSSQ